MLLAFTLLAVILLISFQLLSASQNSWKRVSDEAMQFREARLAFEAITRRLKHATLNQYWDYEFNDRGKPVRYTRQSDLHFVSGNLTAVTDLPPSQYPTHGVFFQAPLGYTDTSNLRGLNESLNTWGYFLEFDEHNAETPPFLRNIVEERPRFRLIELRKPTENLDIFSNSEQRRNQSLQDERGWFAEYLTAGNAEQFKRVVAENILALVFTPLYSDTEDNRARPPLPYDYDSRAGLTDPSATAQSTLHTLPPRLRITLVAATETSIQRTGDSNSTPSYVSQSLFTDSNRYDSDLESLRESLQKERIDYQIFSTVIPMRASKWSNPDWVQSSSNG